jgi:hypothetical protein
MSQPPIHPRTRQQKKWLKQTRFGTRPSDWSGDFNQSMREFYRIVLPVSLKLERWNDINPRSGLINELRLPGQREYKQSMVSFDGHEEWQRSLGLRGLSTRCVPLSGVKMTLFRSIWTSAPAYNPKQMAAYACAVPTTRMSRNSSPSAAA